MKRGEDERLEFSPQELTELMRQVVSHEVNFEVERALGKVRKCVFSLVFSLSALVVALGVIALMSWNGRTLGPAFVLAMAAVGWFVPLWGLTRKRTIEVRGHWVPRGSDDEGGFKFEKRNV